MNSPPTYLRGSNTIDFMLGTERVCRAVIYGGMLRFKDRIHSDHRGLYLDPHVLYLFKGEIHVINKVVTRNLITKHRARARKYRQAVSRDMLNSNMRAKLEELKASTNDRDMTKEEVDRLNELDQEITESLVGREKELK
eukprot:scaffold538145_cov51-Attheya_sp.AAC.1